MTKFQLAQINPFDYNVVGAKIPDSNTQPSDTFKAEDRIVATSLASGFAVANAFLPNLAQVSVATTAVSSTTWSWGSAYGFGSASTNYTNATNSYQAARPVGHGIRLTCPAAPTTITGFVHICVVPVDTTGTTWTFPTDLGGMANAPWYKRFTLAQLTQQSVTVVNKFIDCSATIYRDPSLTEVSAQSNPQQFEFANGWCAIVVALEGAPTTPQAVLGIESIIHFEALPKTGSLAAFSPAAPFNTAELQAVSRTAGATSAVFTENTESQHYRDAADAVGGGMYQAASEIYNDYVVPGLRNAAYATTYGVAGAAAGYLGGLQGVNTPRLMS